MMVAGYSQAVATHHRFRLGGKHFCPVPRVIARAATSNTAPIDTSGKIPDSVKVPGPPPAATPASPADTRAVPQAAPSAASPTKSKGSWTPPYPSMVNTKPLPTEDVKTNIDM